MPSWIPRAEADRLLWLQNYALKLGVHTGTAGIVAADVTLADGLRDSYQWIINRSDQLNTTHLRITPSSLPPIHESLADETPLDECRGDGHLVRLMMCQNL